MTYIRVTREGLRFYFCIAEGAKNLPFTCSSFAVRSGKAQSPQRCSPHKKPLSSYTVFVNVCAMH
jgi:hypothetical protein